MGQLNQMTTVDRKYWTLTAEQALKVLNVSAEDGLTHPEVAQRLNKYGPNEITAKEQTTGWTILLNQFKNFFILLLIAAAFFSWLVGERFDAAIIIVIVLVNVVVGFVQEFKAEKALAALKKMFVVQVTVRREGRKERVGRTQLVPGDMVFLESGDQVPSDLRLVESNNLKIDEAILTGESAPVTKTLVALAGDQAVADRVNLAFAGTLVVFGKGVGVVVATGNQTEFGKIAQLVSQKEEPTPLEIRLQTIGRWFTIISVAIATIILIVGLARGGDPLTMFTFVVALLVAAVPESLPVILTLALAYGAIRLAKRNSIIRRLPVVETLGDIDVIASDKTGTLTKNELTVTQLVVAGRSGLISTDVSGVGYISDGELSNKKVQAEPLFNELILAGIYANESDISPLQNSNNELPNSRNNLENSNFKNLKIQSNFEFRISNLKPSIAAHQSKKSSRDVKCDWSIIGDPTEAALLILAEKVGYHVDQIRRSTHRLAEIPFDSRTKFMATLTQSAKGNFVSVKGAPEVVLEMCDVDPGQKKAILAMVDRLAAEGLRILAFAGSQTNKQRRNLEIQKLKDLTFYGVVGMIDPIREGIKEALAITKRAGIKTIIITGDHQATAVAIAKQLGLTNAESLTGSDLANLSDQELLKKLDLVSIYARTSPEDKLRLIKLLQSTGRIIAVTGDGINDAPALKVAQVGVAMGLRGTDVTRETADLILMDDSFATIVASIELGRGIFDNIKKFITLLLSGNIVEILMVGVAVLAGLPAPFTTLQILWVNLVTDSFPALALGFDPPRANILRDRPELRNQGMVRLILVRSLLLAAIGFGVAFGIFYRSLPQGELYAKTMAFTFVVLFELITVIHLQSDRPLWRQLPQPSRLVLGAVALSLVLQIVAIYGPGERIFKTAFLNPHDWLILIVGLAVFYFCGELIKLVIKKT